MSSQLNKIERFKDIGINKDQMRKIFQESFYQRREMYL